MPKHLSAFWSRILQLLNMIDLQNQCHISKQEHQQLKNDLQIILAETIKKVDRFSLIEIAGGALGMEKIVKHYCDRSNVGKSRQYQSLFLELVFDHNFKIQENLFQMLTSCSALLLPGFDAWSLSTLAYTYALINFVPVMHDGTTLLDQISRHATENLVSFKPKGMCDIVWAYATLGAAHSQLF
jgi:hypothetical protein